MITCVILIDPGVEKMLFTRLCVVDFFTVFFTLSCLVYRGGAADNAVSLVPTKTRVAPAMEISGSVSNISLTLARNNPIHDRITCYRQNYEKINQPACRKLLQELRKDGVQRYLRPRFRKEWEEGLGECDIVLVGGSVSEYISPREVAEVALAIVRGCTVLGRGGKAPIGQKGATVQIFTILQRITSGPPLNANHTISNLSAPLLHSGSDSEVTRCYDGYARVDRAACTTVLRGMDRQPQVKVYQPDEERKWGDSSCEVWFFTGDKPTEIWSPTIMRKAREVLVDCRHKGHGGVKELGNGGCQVAILSRSRSLRIDPTPQELNYNSSTATYERTRVAWT